MRLCIVGDACCYRFSKTLLFIGKCLSEVACETKPSGAFKGRCRFVGIGQVLDRAPLVPAHESAGGWHTVLASDILSSRGRTLILLGFGSSQKPLKDVSESTSPLIPLSDF